MDAFFHFLNLFQDFLPNQTHIPKISFWFLETQGSTIGSICELLLLSRASQDSIDFMAPHNYSHPQYNRKI